MEIWSIDRIEEDVVVLADTQKHIVNMARAYFAEPIAEGDIVVRNEFGIFHTDAEKTAEKKRALFELQKKIFSD